jgi:hypothetical protein
VHARRFDNEMVVLDLVRGQYFSLDEVGSAIWDGLARGMTPAEIVEDLAMAYDAEPRVIQRDVERILGDFVTAGLLLPADDR